MSRKSVSFQEEMPESTEEDLKQEKKKKKTVSLEKMYDFDLEKVEKKQAAQKNQVPATQEKKAKSEKLTPKKLSKAMTALGKMAEEVEEGEGTAVEVAIEQQEEPKSPKTTKADEHADIRSRVPSPNRRRASQPEQAESPKRTSRLRASASEFVPPVTDSGQEARSLRASAPEFVLPDQQVLTVSEVQEVNSADPVSTDSKLRASAVEFVPALSECKSSQGISNVTAPSLEELPKDASSTKQHASASCWEHAVLTPICTKSDKATAEESDVSAWSLPVDASSILGKVQLMLPSPHAKTTSLPATKDASKETPQEEKAVVWKNRTAREAAASNISKAQQQKMDRVLMDCFIQAVKKHVKYLPMMGTTLYGHMRSISRGRGIDCDVKDSSYLWLRPFLESLEEEGLLKLKPEQKDPKVVWINRDHPSFRNGRKASVSLQKTEAIATEETTATDETPAREQTTATVETTATEKTTQSTNSVSQVAEGAFEELPELAKSTSASLIVSCAVDESVTQVSFPALEDDPCEAAADVKETSTAEAASILGKVTSFLAARLAHFVKADSPSSHVETGTASSPATEDISEEVLSKERAVVWKNRTAREAAASSITKTQQLKMDKVLLECFIQAVKKRVKDHDLPMMGTALYGKHMRSISRGRGIDCDVKDSSYLYLRPFLESLEEEGLLKLKPEQRDPKVIWINRNHPSLQNGRKASVSSWKAAAKEETMQQQQDIKQPELPTSMITNATRNLGAVAVEDPASTSCEEAESAQTPSLLRASASEFHPPALESQSTPSENTDKNMSVSEQAGVGEVINLDAFSDADEPDREELPIDGNATIVTPTETEAVAAEEPKVSKCWKHRYPKKETTTQQDTKMSPEATTMISDEPVMTIQDSASDDTAESAQVNTVRGRGPVGGGMRAWDDDEEEDEDDDEDEEADEQQPCKEEVSSLLRASAPEFHPPAFEPPSTHSDSQVAQAVCDSLELAITISSQKIEATATEDTTQQQQDCTAAEESAQQQQQEDGESPALPTSMIPTVVMAVKDTAPVPCSKAESPQVPSLLRASASEFYPPVFESRSTDSVSQIAEGPCEELPKSTTPSAYELGMPPSRRDMEEMAAAASITCSSMQEEITPAAAAAKETPERAAALGGILGKVSNFFTSGLTHLVKADDPSSHVKTEAPSLPATQDTLEESSRKDVVWKKKAGCWTASSTDQSQQEKMDQVLLECFLQAVKKIKKHNLPMMGTILYGKHMRAISRGRGIDCDVKDSSYLWLRNFLDHLEEEGLLKLKPEQKDPMVTWINRDLCNTTVSLKKAKATEETKQQQAVEDPASTPCAELPPLAQYPPQVPFVLRASASEFHPPVFESQSTPSENVVTEEVCETATSVRSQNTEATVTEETTATEESTQSTDSESQVAEGDCEELPVPKLATDVTPQKAAAPAAEEMTEKQQDDNTAALQMATVPTTAIAVEVAASVTCTEAESPQAPSLLRASAPEFHPPIFESQSILSESKVTEVACEDQPKLATTVSSEKTEATATEEAPFSKSWKHRYPKEETTQQQQDVETPAQLTALIPNVVTSSENSSSAPCAQAEPPQVPSLLRASAPEFCPPVFESLIAEGACEDAVCARGDAPVPEVLTPATTDAKESPKGEAGLGSFFGRMTSFFTSNLFAPQPADDLSSHVKTGTASLAATENFEEVPQKEKAVVWKKTVEREADSYSINKAQQIKMDQILMDCFLQVVKTRVKDRELPIMGTTLYGKHMRAISRNRGISCDVKDSSYVWLRPFLEYLENDGLLKLKPEQKDPMVIWVNRHHPLVRQLQPKKTR